MRDLTFDGYLGQFCSHSDFKNIQSLTVVRPELDGGRRRRIEAEDSFLWYGFGFGAVARLMELLPKLKSLDIMEWRGGGPPAMDEWVKENRRLDSLTIRDKVVDLDDMHVPLQLSHSVQSQVPCFNDDFAGLKKLAEKHRGWTFTGDTYENYEFRDKIDFADGDNGRGTFAVDVDVDVDAAVEFNEFLVSRLAANVSSLYVFEVGGKPSDPPLDFPRLLRAATRHGGDKLDEIVLYTVHAADEGFVSRCTDAARERCVLLSVRSWD